jgi:GSH-dependent disulfide-bond oxidoreductase
VIELYYAPTPNGLKVRLYLEEAALPHRIVPVSLSRGEQFRPEFLAIAPNGKIPAIVDTAPADGGAPLTLMESGAILWYLAVKTGRFLPVDERGRAEVSEWLYWQMAGLGPMAGQAGYFRVYAPKRVPFAIERYTKETSRLYGVLDRRLADREFIAGGYSIADIACYPWIVPHAGHGQALESFPHLSRWFSAVGRRPSVLRTYEGVEDVYGRPARPVAQGPARPAPRAAAAE